MAIKQGHGWKDKPKQSFHKCLNKKKWGCLFERKQWSHLQRKGWVNGSRFMLNDVKLVEHEENKG
jgi:hypothetical protein